MASINSLARDFLFSMNGPREVLTSPVLSHDLRKPVKLPYNALTADVLEGLKYYPLQDRLRTKIDETLPSAYI